MPTEQLPSIEALTVAYLTAQGRKQSEIAHILKISQAAVSRLYGDVKDKYIERSFREDLLDPNQVLEVHSKASPETLRAGLEELAIANGKPCPVVYRIATGTSDGGGEFSLQAAVIVKDLLTRVRSTVGVAWGSTIWQVGQALRTLPPQKPWRTQAPVEFVPLCGDPLINAGEFHADRTSSRIASDLSKIVNGEKAPRPAWLGLVPAFIPFKSFKPEELPVIDRLIDMVPQYGQIFGPRCSKAAVKTPVAADLDMILTSAGPAEHPVSFGHSPLLSLGQKDSEELAANIYGDIGGVLVARSNVKDNGRNPRTLVGKITRNWTGLKMEHLENCSRRAFEQNQGQGGRPGVVLLGLGPDRAPVVLEAVRRGLVNHLIVSSDLEAAITALTPKTPEGAPAPRGASDGRRSGSR